MPNKFKINIIFFTEGKQTNKRKTTKPCVLLNIFKNQINFFTI